MNVFANDFTTCPVLARVRNPTDRDGLDRATSGVITGIANAHR
jgi:hypothetical protein